MGEGGGGKAAPRAGAVADAGLAAARRAPAHPVDAGVPARDAALAKGPTDAGRPRVAPDAGELQARARPTPRAGQPETAPRPRPKSKFDEYIEEGRKAMRRHKYALARRYFTKALHLRRTSVRVMRLMAEAHYRAHEYPAARYWFEKALQRAPKSASLNARLGKVYARLGKRSKACRYFLRAFHLRPNSRTYRLNVENYRCH